MRRAALPLLLLTVPGCCGRRSPPPLETSAPTPSPPAPAPSAAPAVPVAEFPREQLLASPDAPIHGSIQPADPTDPRRLFLSPGAARVFVPHDALHAATAPDGTTVVHSTTGLWLHAGPLAPRLVRLAPPPVTAMALSRDGHSLAFVRPTRDRKHGSLQVMTLPARTLGPVIAPVDLPTRLRFSPDGRALVLASTAGDSVSRVDLASRRVSRFDAGTDVNDAIALPGSLVAIASDDDEVVVIDMSQRTRRFSSHDSMRHHRGGPIPLLHWNPGMPTQGPRDASLFGFLRDQNAVGFDESTETLWAGGDDNLVWRFEHALGSSPTLRPPFEMNGNVSEIVAVPEASGGPAVLVSLDTLSVHRFSSQGAAEGSLAPMLWRMFSGTMRIEPAPDRGVLLTPDGALALWSPLTGRVEASPHYPFVPPAAWSVTPADTVIAFVRSPVIVHRVAHGAEADDAATRIIGTVDLRDQPYLAAYPDGTRLLVGASPSGTLRAFYLPPGGALEPPLDSPAFGPPVTLVAATDASLAAVLDTGGNLVEFSLSPRRARLVGRIDAPRQGVVLGYLARERRWTASVLGGQTLPVTPVP